MQGQEKRNIIVRANQSTTLAPRASMLRSDWGKFSPNRLALPTSTSRLGRTLGAREPICHVAVVFLTSTHRTSSLTAAEPKLGLPEVFFNLKPDLNRKKWGPQAYALPIAHKGGSPKRLRRQNPVRFNRRMRNSHCSWRNTIHRNENRLKTYSIGHEN